MNTTNNRPRHVSKEIKTISVRETRSSATVRSMAQQGQMSSADKASRAVQAGWGLGMVLAPFTELDTLLTPCVNELACIESARKAEHDAIHYRAKAFFVRIHQSLPDSSMFVGDTEAMWDIFFHGFDLFTLQLRVFPIQMVTLGFFGRIASLLETTEQSLLRLPITAQVVYAVEGKSVFVENPCWLSFLDLLLVLDHARREHVVLRDRSRLDSQTRSNIARLDAYTRLILVRSVSVVEGFLNDYGALLAEMSSGNNALEKWREKSSVYLKIGSVFDAWQTVPPTAPIRNSGIENEFMRLIEVRNRIAHPDDRAAAWNAFRNAAEFLNDEAHPRTGALIKCAQYGVPGSHVGYEYALACYSVDLVARMLDYLYSIAFPDVQYGIPWLGFPRTEGGFLDLERFLESDPMLRLD